MSDSKKLMPSSSAVDSFQTKPAGESGDYQCGATADGIDGDQSRRVPQGGSRKESRLYKYCFVQYKTAWLSHALKQGCSRKARMPTHACVMTGGAPSKQARLGGKANYCDSSNSLRLAKHETLFPEKQEKIPLQGRRAFDIELVRKK